jgi:TolA-binding protein
MGIAIAAGLIAVGAAAFRQNSISPQKPTIAPPPPAPPAPATPVTPPAQVVATPAVSNVPPAVVAPTPAPALTRSAAQELRIARGMVQAGLQDQASVKLAELVKSYPSTKEALEGYFLMAHIRQSQGRINDALATYLEIADRYKKYPRAPEALFQMAVLIRQSDREQRDLEARRVLTNLVMEYPRSRWAPRALVTKAEIEDVLRLTEADPILGTAAPSSLITYRRVVSEYPKSAFHPVAMVRLARGYEKLKKYNLAAQAFSDFATMHPKGADEAWYKSAEIYRRYLKDVEKAKVAYTNVPAESRYYPQAQRQLKSINSRKPAPPA